MIDFALEDIMKPEVIRGCSKAFEGLVLGQSIEKPVPCANFNLAPNISIGTIIRSLIGLLVGSMVDEAKECHQDSDDDVMITMF